MNPMQLASFLGLRPLDRVQINDAREIAEMRFTSSYSGTPSELPFMFYQRVLPDGRLEVRSPGGYATSIAPEDVCDVIPGKPIPVRAMPPKIFLERLGRRRDPGNRDAPGPECFADAHVLYASVDRWGNPSFHVWFDDPTLNGERPTHAPLPDAESARLRHAARRTAMPVQSVRGGASASADGGVQRVADASRYLVSQFISSAARGRREVVSALAFSGHKPLTTAAINKLIYAVPD